MGKQALAFVRRQGGEKVVLAGVGEVWAWATSDLATNGTRQIIRPVPDHYVLGAQMFFWTHHWLQSTWPSETWSLWGAHRATGCGGGDSNLLSGKKAALLETPPR